MGEAGKSVAEVAMTMAELILVSLEGKSWSEISRAEYLQTVRECADALRDPPRH